MYISICCYYNDDGSELIERLHNGSPSMLYYCIYLVTGWEILVNLVVRQAFQASAILRVTIIRSKSDHACVEGTDHNL